MKIHIEEHNRFVTVEENIDGDIHAAVELIAGALIALSYGMETVVSGFESYIEEHHERIS